jgi:ABC-2 type transport system ATP-binding protein
VMAVMWWMPSRGCTESKTEGKKGFVPWARGAGSVKESREEKREMLISRAEMVQSIFLEPATRSAEAIRLSGISKGFRRRERGEGAPWWKREWKDKVALHALDLVVGTGGVTGILGPNGSGKSTLIRILATLLTPDQGTASVFGWDVVKESSVVRRHVNRVSVEAAFFKELSPWENMVYAARLYGGGGGKATRKAVLEILDRLGLPLDTVDQPMKQLSRGQQQKVAIARSFLTAPSLLLMDEPTTGLDPRSKKEVQSVLQMLRTEREVTVLLCTHDMDAAAAMCDRVLMMDEGRVLADGSPEELGRMYAQGGRENLEEVFMHLTGKDFAAREAEEGGE